MRVPEQSSLAFSTRRFFYFALLSLFLLTDRRAFANGAFPDAQNILTPEDRPLEILMATTFGVVLSHDGGKTWLWTCEQAANQLGYLYQLGPAPRHRVFTLANKSLAYSDDLTCGWRVAGGALLGQEISDAWADPALPDRVLAVGVTCCDDAKNSVYSLFESGDGGATFGAARFVAASGDVIKGVETSVSQPSTIYMTMSVAMATSATTVTYLPVLARSADGGATWTQNDLTSSLGNGNLRLIAVDPRAPDRVFLLWNDAVKGQALAVSEDGGTTATIRLQTPDGGGVIKAFVSTATGALLLATDTNGTPALYRSVDQGATFEEVAQPPHIRGLSRRGAMVYAAADNFMDGYAIATSTDDGTTWKPLMSYNKVRAIDGCVKAACQDMCKAQVDLLWPAAVCSASSSGGGGGGCSVVPPSLVSRDLWCTRIARIFGLLMVAAVFALRAQSQRRLRR